MDLSQGVHISHDGTVVFGCLIEGTDTFTIDQLVRVWAEVTSDAC